jgi:hypothetical protein
LHFLHPICTQKQKPYLQRWNDPMVSVNHHIAVMSLSNHRGIHWKT